MLTRSNEGRRAFHLTALNQPLSWPFLQRSGDCWQEPGLRAASNAAANHAQPGCQKLKMGGDHALAWGSLGGGADNRKMKPVKVL